MVIGQLHNRLLRPYLQMPFSMATLVDPSRPDDERVSLATAFLEKKDCCVERHFALPCLKAMREAGGPSAVVQGSFAEDLAMAFRIKSTNIECELNFSRAASMRGAMRGRCHNITSLVAKHVGAEVKLAQKRKLLSRKDGLCIKYKQETCKDPLGRTLCKPSRKTGYSLFLKKKYAELRRAEQQCQVHSGDWYSDRKSIAAVAAKEWREAPRQFKRKLSADACSLNAAAKHARKQDALRKDQVLRDQQSEADAMTRRQICLLDASLKHGLLSGSKAAFAPLPSTVRPQALADHAGQKGLNPLPLHDQDLEETALNNPVTAGPLAPVQDTFESSHVNSAVASMITSSSSLHGLGDSEFGVSEAMVEYSLDRCPGFVQCGHNQLRQAHGHVTEKVAERVLLEEGDDIEQPHCCEHLLGRHCLCDIKNTDAFISAVEMVKEIARVMSKKRSIKLGKQWYLAPTSDTMWPIVLLQTENPSTAYGRLAKRICFSPLEIDLLHCEVDVKGDGEYTLKLVTGSYDALGSVSYLKSDSMNEFAVWFSQNYKDGWSCKLYLLYDISFDPLTIRLKPSHGPTDPMLGGTGEAGRGFNSKDEKDSDGDPAAYSFVSQLLSQLETQSGVKKKRAQKSSSTAAKTGLGKLKQVVSNKGALSTFRMSFIYFSIGVFLLPLCLHCLSIC